MPPLLAGFLLCSGLGCAPPTDPGPGPDLTITTAGECARISFQITGPTSVTTWYPTASCTVGLVVITSGGASTWDGATRTLTLRLRVANTSGQPVTLPVRLELPVAGKTVTVPEGMAGDSLVPLNMDSTLAGDRKLWLVWGGTGTLAPGDSSETRWVTVEVKAPVTKGRLWFVSSGEEIPTVPAVAPDSIPGWIRHDSAYSAAGYLKRALSVMFQVNATHGQRQAAIDAINGAVIGGWRLSSGDGRYLIGIPGDPSDGEVDSLVSVLRQLPQVEAASRVSRARRAARRPRDGLGWEDSTWALVPDASLGENWALEEIAAPLAWGCSTGDSQTRMAVLDHPFDMTSAASNAVAPFPQYGAAPADPDRHGTKTAGLLAAVGDDGVATAGVMWRARLRLHDLGPNPVWSDLARAVHISATDGYGIVVLPYREGWITNPAGSADSAKVTDAIAQMLPELTRVPPGQLPLLVVPAGNDNVDAWWAVLPALKPMVPDSAILVVGGSVARLGTSPRDRWGRSNFSHGFDAGSNFGPLVDVYAPAVDVRVPILVNGVETSVVGEAGTSVAVALAAGIAGLLKSFDPSLTTRDLRQLLLAGAAAGDRAMPNHAGKYLANAYESLKLAARVPGVPICGNEVGVEMGPAGATGLYVERGPPAAPTREVIYAPSGPADISFISVAQGGRLLGMTQGYAVRPLRFQTGSWVPQPAVSGFARVQYLEFDTAYYASGPGNQPASFEFPILTLKRDDGTTLANYNPSADPTLLPVHADVSHDGRWIAYQGSTVQQSGLVTVRRFLVDSIGRRQPVEAYTLTEGQCDAQTQAGCADHFRYFQPAAWTQDRAVVTFLSARGDWDAPGNWISAHSSIIRMAAPGGPVATTAVSGVWLSNARQTAAGDEFIADEAENDGTTCERVVRAAAALGTVLSRTVLPPESACGGYGWRGLFTAPVAGTRAALPGWWQVPVRGR